MSKRAFSFGKELAARAFSRLSEPLKARASARKLAAENQSKGSLPLFLSF
jgi:hypothetical protein